MLTIGDLVTVDKQAEFRSDVQLDAFDDPEQNLSLLRSYLFSSAIPEGRGSLLKSISSVGLLDRVVETFLNGTPNRFVAVANYGHGKSSSGAGPGELFQPAGQIRRNAHPPGKDRERA